MTDMTTCASPRRSHFHGNGTCDAARAANKREDSGMSAATGMESEIAPYYGDAAHSGASGEVYGPDHAWTPEQEAGLTTLPQDSFNDPLTATEAARASWRALLARNVGRNVLVRFLIGTQNMVTVEGELYEVGTDYLVIYQPAWDSHITADLFSVKFVEFRDPPGTPMYN